MKCSTCSGETKYFKDYESGSEGYRCKDCGDKRGIPTFILGGVVHIPHEGEDCCGIKTPLNNVYDSASIVLLSRALSTEDMIRRQRQYIEAIQPFIKQKANIIGMQPVRYVLYNGAWEREILWQSGSKELCDMCDQCIEQIGKEIFKAR